MSDPNIFHKTRGDQTDDAANRAARARTVRTAVLVFVSTAIWGVMAFVLIPCFLATPALGEVTRERDTCPGLEKRRLLPMRDSQRFLQRVLCKRHVASTLACNELAPNTPQLGDEHT